MGNINSISLHHHKLYKLYKECELYKLCKLLSPRVYGRGQEFTEEFTVLSLYLTQNIEKYAKSLQS
jgi:hypothetical protein